MHGMHAAVLASAAHKLPPTRTAALPACCASRVPHTTRSKQCVATNTLLRTTRHSTYHQSVCDLSAPRTASTSRRTCKHPRAPSPKKCSHRLGQRSRSRSLQRCTDDGDNAFTVCGMSAGVSGLLGGHPRLLRPCRSASECTARTPLVLRSLAPPAPERVLTVPLIANEAPTHAALAPSCAVPPSIHPVVARNSGPVCAQGNGRGRWLSGSGSRQRDRNGVPEACIAQQEAPAPTAGPGQRVGQPRERHCGCVPMCRDAALRVRWAC
jgi:hypothetical protein